jgi:DNA-binding NarL/FixJ family response regulator
MVGNSRQDRIRVLVVDDHSLICEGLTALLGRQVGMSVVGSAAAGEEALLSAERLRPDVIIMDLMLPDMDGIDATQRILRKSPSISVVALSASHTMEHVYRALRAGARGYVVKDSVSDELVKAVRAVHAGKYYLSRGVDHVVLEAALSLNAVKSPMEGLSPRERDVLRWVVAGSSSADIAAHLCLSRKTIDTYRSRLMVKLGVANRSALIRFAIEQKLTVS